MQLITQIRDWINATLGIPGTYQLKIIGSIVLVLLVVLVRYLILRFSYRRYDDVRIRYRWRKTSTYVASVLVAVGLGGIWFQAFGSVATFIGLVSAGLTIALQTPITNLAGFVFILWRRPFEVGDRIEIGGTRGDVVDQRIFMFTMMEIGNWVDADQSTGRVVHVPNGQVFSEPLANYSRGFQYIWHELPILVTFESNWQKAKEILTGIASEHAEHLSSEAEKRVKEAAKRFMIFYTTLTPTVYTKVADSGVLLTIRYLCEPRRRRGTEQAIWEDVLRAFAKCDDIDFAYPTQRFYNNVVEGKEGARAKPKPPAS
jgi:small-conductance mechanosensitive channel